MIPKASKEFANFLVSSYFEVSSKSYNKFTIGIFEGFEYIAKGKAIIEVLYIERLNKNQKNELIKIIKEL